MAERSPRNMTDYEAEYAAFRWDRPERFNFAIDVVDRWASERPLVPTRDVSLLSKASLPENDALPSIDVDSETFAVRVDGELIEPWPAQELPMAQRYFLF